MCKCKTLLQPNEAVTTVIFGSSFEANEIQFKSAIKAANTRVEVTGSVLELLQARHHEEPSGEFKLYIKGTDDIRNKEYGRLLRPCTCSRGQSSCVPEQRQTLPRLRIRFPMRLKNSLKRTSQQRTMKTTRHHPEPVAGLFNGSFFGTDFG